MWGVGVGMDVWARGSVSKSGNADVERRRDDWKQKHTIYNKKQRGKAQISVTVKRKTVEFPLKSVASCFWDPLECCGEIKMCAEVGWGNDCLDNI